MRVNVKQHMMAFIAGGRKVTDPTALDVWMEATAFIPEWHAALQAEWHSRNFSWDEAREVDYGPCNGFIHPEIPSIARLLNELALEKVGVEDDG